MAKREENAAAERRAPASGRINARVIDEENGLRLLPGVYAVRIRSEGYNLLIMEDYLPALGQIDGTIVFLTAEREVQLEDVHGFYKHQHNEFTLLIEGEAAG